MVCSDRFRNSSLLSSPFFSGNLSLSSLSSRALVGALVSLVSFVSLFLSQSLRKTPWKTPWTSTRRRARLRAPRVHPRKESASTAWLHAPVACSRAAKRAAKITKPCHRSVALFNLMAWHTCGRSTNVANMHIEHSFLMATAWEFNFPSPSRSKQDVVMISYSRASKLDELKNNNTYDWGAADPVAPRTLMFVAQLVPAAPHREGVRKRRVLPSANSVGTVRKNISLLLKTMAA